MSEIAFIEASIWSPAGELHGPNLEAMENFLPEYGVLRSVQRPVNMKEFTHGAAYATVIDGVVNGAYAHVYPFPDSDQEDIVLYINGASAPETQGFWVLPPRGQADLSEWNWLRPDGSGVESFITVIPANKQTALNKATQHTYLLDSSTFETPSVGDHRIYSTIRARGFSFFFPEQGDIEWRVEATSTLSFNAELGTNTGSSGYASLDQEEWVTEVSVYAQGTEEAPSALAVLLEILSGTLRVVEWGAFDPEDDTDDALSLKPVSYDGWNVELGTVSNIAEALRRITSYSIVSDEVPANGSGSKLVAPFIQNAQDIDWFDEGQDGAGQPVEGQEDASNPETGIDLTPTLQFEAKVTVNQPNMSAVMKIKAGNEIVKQYTVAPSAVNTIESITRTDINDAIRDLNPEVLRKGLTLEIIPKRGEDDMDFSSSSDLRPASGDLADGFDGTAATVTVGPGTSKSGVWNLTPSTWPNGSNVLLLHYVPDFVLATTGTQTMDVYFQQSTLPETRVAEAVEVPQSDDGVDKFISIPDWVVEQIDPNNALTIRIECTSNDGIRFSDGYLEIPDRGVVSVERARIYPTSDTDTIAFTHRLDISTFGLSLPFASANTKSRADREDIYTGNLDTLFVYSRGEWSEVVDGTAYPSGYANGSPEATEWNFCSFGQDLVVATNRVDPIQVRQNNTGDFGDLITAPASDPPKARFVAAVRNRLMIANLSGTGRFSDEVGWSVSDDITDFESAGSDFQRLYSATPGEITGMVGGLNGVVFKRNSMYVLEFIGGTLVFRVEPISNSIGTPYGRSIVEANGVLYWWDGANFRVWDGAGSRPEVIGQDEISRFILYGNKFHGNGTLNLRRAPAGRLTEALRIQGAYDHGSGIIMWAYQTRDSSDGVLNHAILYNTREDRWGFLDMRTGSSQLGSLVNFPLPSYPNADLSTIFSRRNTEPVAGRSLRGIGMIRNRDVAGGGIDTMILSRFGSSVSHPATLVTKVRQVVEDENVTIHSVRPVFTSDPGDTWPEMTIKIEASNDPRMLVGVEERIASSAQANELQQFPFKIGGRWFRFTVAIAAARSEYLEGFSGLYLEYRKSGRQ